MCSECRISQTAELWGVREPNRFEVQSSSSFRARSCTCEGCDQLIVLKKYDFEGMPESDQPMCKVCHHEVEVAG